VFNAELDFLVWFFFRPVVCLPIPLSKRTNEMRHQQPSTSTGSTKENSSDISNPSRPQCLLLVEDDRSVRRYLEVTLQRSGYQVITASDGLEAMKLALSSPIDAVVTDAIMPNLSGQQLARFVRGNPKLAHVPIVLLTGQENKAAAAAPDDLIDAFLYKPVKAEELTNCLALLLQKTPSPDQST
jgi:CheY-like chemotaxis protein